ncbi:hypothetical protein PBY51_001171 [Eleginops maclovinus]|uniref:Uncharacterized protein n=1 Tax=Eleginops maclovinus TaxID=56733 RepID=A0AAN7XH40_ELEMC|nr:hypothetical protein PBY51_001171 [Eleginops maclovinus]
MRELFSAAQPPGRKPGGDKYREKQFPKGRVNPGGGTSPQEGNEYRGRRGSKPKRTITEEDESPGGKSKPKRASIGEGSTQKGG